MFYNLVGDQRQDENTIISIRHLIIFYLNKVWIALLWFLAVQDGECPCWIRLQSLFLF